MKITLRNLKPRNPLVAAARLRRAGAHRRSGSAERQHARLALHHALVHERHPLP